MKAKKCIEFIGTLVKKLAHCCGALMFITVEQSSKRIINLFIYCPSPPPPKVLFSSKSQKKSSQQCKHNILRYTLFKTPTVNHQHCLALLSSCIKHFIQCQYLSQIFFLKKQFNLKEKKMFSFFVFCKILCPELTIYPLLL